MYVYLNESLINYTHVLCMYHMCILIFIYH